MEGRRPPHDTGISEPNVGCESKTAPDGRRPKATLWPKATMWPKATKVSEGQSTFEKIA